MATLPYAVAVTPDQAPIASFITSGNIAGLPVSFNASASTVTYGSIVSYIWKFGDGSKTTTTGATTTHTYAMAGTYKVTLTETDTAGTSTIKVFTGQTMSRNGGASAKATTKITVS